MRTSGIGAAANRPAVPSCADSSPRAATAPATMAPLPTLRNSRRFSPSRSEFDMLRRSCALLRSRVQTYSYDGYDGYDGYEEPAFLANLIGPALGLTVLLGHTSTVRGGGVVTRTFENTGYRPQGNVRLYTPECRPHVFTFLAPSDSDARGTY